MGFKKNLLGLKNLCLSFFFPLVFDVFLIIIIFCHFWKSYLSQFFLVSFIIFGVCNLNCSFYFYLCMCVGKDKPILCVLGNCSNKDLCHVRVGLLVKWWATNKIDINAHIGKNHIYFLLLFLLNIPTCGCGVHPPHVMTKLKRDERILSI
jgi:hypothetical protein